jgi:chromate transporter
MKEPHSNSDLKEVARLFLRLGFTAFGGPAAHIAMMRHEVVTRFKWMSEEHFLDLIGATNLIPGPNSTEMAIHIGNERAGWKGLVVAGFCFIMPAVIITGILAWLYKLYGTLPQIQPYIYGIKPAVIAVVLGAIYPLAKKSLKSLELAIIGILALTLALINFNDIYIMFGGGLIALIITAIRKKATTKNTLPFLAIQSPGSGLVGLSNAKLFFSFLKIGSILYGSGYVLFAFLDSEFVAKGFLRRQQLIDAIAVGQFTPGPVFSSVTFVGYQMNGWHGAMLATIGIFLPSFLFVAFLNPLILSLRRSAVFASFLDAVNITSIAIIIAVCYTMGKDSITDWRTILIACLAAITAFTFRKLNSAWIILGGSLAGYVFSLI